MCGPSCPLSSGWSFSHSLGPGKNKTEPLTMQPLGWRLWPNKDVQLPLLGALRYDLRISTRACAFNLFYERHNYLAWFELPLRGLSLWKEQLGCFQSTEIRLVFLNCSVLSLHFWFIHLAKLLSASECWVLWPKKSIILRHLQFFAQKILRWAFFSKVAAASRKDWFCDFSSIVAFFYGFYKLPRRSWMCVNYFCSKNQTT